MNKFETIRAFLSCVKYKDDGLGMNAHIVMGQNDINLIKAALTQAAEIERGNKVVVPREPTKEMVLVGSNAHDDCIDNGYHSDADGNTYNYTLISPDAPYKIYKAMIAASEGK